MAPYLRLRLAALLVFTWGGPIFPLSAADIGTVLSYNKDLTINDLPSALEKRFQGAPSDVYSSLAAQPTLELNGVTLTITGPTAGSSRTLSVNELRLLGGARIVTQGVNLEIDANVIASDRGTIASFNTTAAAAPALP